MSDDSIEYSKYEEFLREYEHAKETIAKIEHSIKIGNDENFSSDFILGYVLAIIHNRRGEK